MRTATRRSLLNPPNDFGNPYNPLYGVPAVSVLTQLHTHTSVNGGAYTAAEVVTFYDGVGYGALAITDHDVVTAQPAGIDTAIEGCEQSPTTGHIVSINTDYDRGSETDSQTIIDAIVADGGQAILSHPLYDGTPILYTTMDDLTGFLGIEIANQNTIGAGASDAPQSKGFAINYWDAINLAGMGKWGFANDDFHSIDEHDAYNTGRVWVFCKSNRLVSIMEALQRGNFAADVANFGVTPGYPVRTCSGVSITCPGATAIRFVGDTGLLEEDSGETGSYTFSGTEKFVRIEAVGGYTEGFDSDIDQTNRWGVVAGTWTVGSGILQQTNAASAANRINLKRPVYGDIELTLDVRFNSATAETAGLRINSVEVNDAYLLSLRRTAAAYANSLTLYLIRNGTNTVLATAAATLSLNTWYTIRLTYTHSTGHWQARYWATGEAEPGTWDIDVYHQSLREGHICLHCNYNQDFDNLVITKAFKTFYQPIPIAKTASGTGLLNNLVGFWAGNEISGDLLDAHIHALHLDDTNTVGNATGLVEATARQYVNASHQYHSRPGDDALLSAGDVDFTLAAWVYLDTKTASSGIAAKLSNVGAYEYGLTYTASTIDRFRFVVSVDGTSLTYRTADTLGSPATGTWYLVICWHDSTANTINIQINNGTVDSTAHTTGVFNSTDWFRVGRVGTATDMDGRIGPVMFWKSAAGGGGVLTAAQRTWLYNSGAGRKYGEFTY